MHMPSSQPIGQVVSMNLRASARIAPDVDVIHGGEIRGGDPYAVAHRTSAHDEGESHWTSSSFVEAKATQRVEDLEMGRRHRSSREA